jgi:hypothetical protein
MCLIQLCNIRCIDVQDNGRNTDATQAADKKVDRELFLYHYSTALESFVFGATKFADGLQCWTGSKQLPPTGSNANQSLGVREGISRRFQPGN